MAELREREPGMTEYKVEYWLTDVQLKELEYSGYWNDEDAEKAKDLLYILDGNFSKMEEYLRQEESPQYLARAVEVLKTRFNRELKGTGIDLAAGILWAAPHLFRLGKIEKLYCLEFSKHRLLKIGPEVLQHYGVPKEKTTLVVGSFYDIRLPDESLDFVFMSAAFHHADDSERLLKEIKRILKPQGVVIIIGENYINFLKAYLRHLMKYIISKLVPSKLQQKLFRRSFNTTSPLPKKGEFLPPDLTMGDHYYTFRQYKTMFVNHGFEVQRIRLTNSPYCGFILIKNA